MTQLQTAELNIFKEFIKVCDKLNLKYYLVCGSALGAAKYQGFIPWDDDMDVALPRKDYEIFCEKAQSLLPENLFLQNYRTEKYTPIIYTKIRDSKTTYIEKSSSATNMNHGVYIDVFPLDGYPDDPKQQAKIEKEKKRYNLSSMCCYNMNYSWKVKLLIGFEKLCGLHKNPAKFVSRLEKCITAYPLESSEYWCNHGNWQGKLEYAPKSQYGDGSWAMFEGLKVRIPEKYDEYLTQKYGDWRADLPDDQKVGHHYYQICDVSQPYTKYVEVLSDNKIRVKQKSI